MNSYVCSELLKRATAPDATKNDLNKLGAWFYHYGDRYWNGEYYDCDNGLRLYPVYETVSEYDDVELVGYEFR